MTDYNGAGYARAKEAQHLASNNLSLGAVYLLGYRIECHLKYLHQLRQIPFPNRGAAGHHLRGLWKSSTLRVGQASGPAQNFLDVWDTSLRYEVNFGVNHNAADLLRGGDHLADIINRAVRTAQIQNTQRPGGRRRR